MNLIWIRTACALLFVCGALSSSKAFAYSWFNYCSAGFSSGPTKWGGNTRMYRDVCSIPDDSTGAAQGYWAVGDSWTNVLGRQIIDPWWWYSASCTITLGDGLNETARVGRSTISNLNGITNCIYGTCITSQSTFSECDIKIANDQGAFPNQDESFWNWSSGEQSRVVLAHEWGHALGLGHTDGYDIMRTYTPYPLVGGLGGNNSEEPYPDDAAGTYALYGISNRTNVFSSAQKTDSGNNIVRVNAQSSSSSSGQDTVTVRRGNNVDIWYSACNNGTTDFNPTSFRIYIDSTFPSSGGTTLFQSTNATLWHGGCFTEVRSLTIPSSLSPGSYWIYWKIDNNNAVTEFSEGDNVVHSAMNLNVTN